MPPEISIVIPTFNRCESLRDTIQSLKQQELTSSVQVELIIVNNNSSDRTKEVVEEEALSSPFKIRHVFEAKQGISAARNRGIRESLGQFLIYTDDDVILDKGWLQACYDTFTQFGADSVGGKIIPLWGKKPDSWVLAPELSSILNGPFALLDHGNSPFVLDKLDFNFFYGANMGFRKTALLELGGFREDLGLVGKKRLYGEDTEMISRFFKAGKKMVYTPDAVVHHKVPANRISLSYIRKWRFDKALDAPPVGSGKIPPFWLLKECVANMGGVLGAYCSGKKTVGIAKEMQFWTQLGQIVGILKA